MPSLDTDVRAGERGFDVVGDGLVELVVLRVGDLRLGARPERRGAVHLLGRPGVTRVGGLSFHLPLRHPDRDGDVVGVLADDRPEVIAVEQLVLAVAQVQRHLRAARRLRDRLQRVGPLAAALPADRAVRGDSGAPRRQGHAVRHDERRVEADAELADELRVVRLLAGQLLNELTGARVRDRPDVVDGFLA